MRTCHQVDYGKGSHTIRDAYALVDADDVRGRLERVFRSPDYQPPTLPRVGVQLMALMKKPDVNLAHVRTLLESDPVIAARILKVASSAFYATRTPIRTLQDAMVRLGVKQMTDIFFQVSLQMRVFRAPRYQHAMDRLRRHSAATAIVARRVCRKTSVGDEYAFLCGLLHDVGIAASLIALSEGDSNPPELVEIQGTLDQFHEEAASHISRMWKLPDDVALVIANHHDFNIAGHPHPVVAAVMVADGLASKLGFPSGFREPTEQEMIQAIETVGLTEKQLELVCEEAEPELANIQ